MSPVDPDRLRELAAAVYERCAVPPEDARLLADTLVQADLWGHSGERYDALLEGYESKRILRESLRAEAEHLVVPLVLGYFERDARRDAPAGVRPPRTLTFLEEAVPRALRHAR